MDNNKSYRIQIAHENLDEYIPSISYRYPNETKTCREDTVFYKDVRALALSEVVISENKVIVEVRCQDTLEASYDEVLAGYKPLVLNMASDRVPGGGYKKGSMAQEEELFRRTTLSLSLENNHMYPLKLHAAIYSPKVLVFRDVKYKIYKWKECHWIDVVSTAAIRNPKLQSNNMLNPQDEKVTLEKIRGIFKIGIIKGHDCIILSALGCGAFHNPPDHIANIFKQVIEEYGHHFKKIVFAILGSNFLPFYKVLNKLTATTTIIS